MVLTGRGGFGNHVNQVQAAPAATSSPPPVRHFTSPKQTIRTGRGGFGNSMTVDKADFESAQQYLNHANKVERIPDRYYTGRGGRGNIVFNKNSSSTSSSSSSRKLSPTSSEGLSAVMTTPHRRDSTSAGLWSKLKTSITH